jgi:hypothetical protein
MSGFYTKTIWSQLPTTEDLEVIYDMDQQMYADGKYLGRWSSPFGGLGVNKVAPITYYREWATEQDAQAWVDYLSVTFPDKQISSLCSAEEIPAWSGLTPVLDPKSL